MTKEYRTAPSGFTEEQWETFLREGIITIENALSPDEIQTYLAAIDRLCQKHPKYVEGDYLSVQNFVEWDPTLAGLIDNDRHIGFAYDLYGEQLKLQLSELFLRGYSDGKNNKWHPDGARALPYGVFSPTLPLQIKVGYWLTDLPRAEMGNFVYMPGSHKEQYFSGYDTHNSLPGEVILKVPAGTMTIMHGSIWHRVEPNLSDVTRKNLFLAYCPSWITSADRLISDPDWLATLNREQQIIMRSYDHAYANAKPPPEHFPLFLDRETGLKQDENCYAEHVQLHRRKRKTWHEKLGERVLT